MADVQYPDDLKYAESDEWIRIEGDTATIGISDYAQDALNDLVYVEFKEVGDKLDQGEGFGEVESVKAASEVYMPVAGEIIEVNGDLEGNPETVNEDPYGAGWMIKIKMSDPSESEDLLSAEEYRDLTA